MKYTANVNAINSKSGKGRPRSFQAESKPTGDAYQVMSTTIRR